MSTIIEISTSVLVQLPIVRAKYPKESSALISDLLDLRCGDLSIDQLTDMGRLLVDSKDENRLYLYQHVSPGEVALYLYQDKAFLKLEVMSFVEITYTQMGEVPPQDELTKLTNTVIKPSEFRCISEELH